MSHQQQRLRWPAISAAPIALSVLVFVSGYASRTPRKAENPFRVQDAAAPTKPSRPNYVNYAALWPRLRWNLKALGNRLDAPGNERLSLTGSLIRGDNPQTLPVVAILEFPDRLRLMMQIGGQSRILTFNGTGSQLVGGTPDSGERDLIETLVCDTVEHFFDGQMRGSATRLLADHLRLDDGSDANYRGPYYDVFQVSEQVESALPARECTKLYYFNSETLMLERVKYDLERDGSKVAVEVQLSNWQKVQGQQVPTRIVRSESGRPVATFTFNLASLSPKVDDGSFGS